LLWPSCLRFHRRRSGSKNGSTRFLFFFPGRVFPQVSSGFPTASDLKTLKVLVNRGSRLVTLDQILLSGIFYILIFPGRSISSLTLLSEVHSEDKEQKVSSC